MQTSLNAAHTDDDDQPFYTEEGYARFLAARQRLDDELAQILTANRETLAQMSPAELLAERNRTVDQVNSLSDEEAEIEEDNGQPTHKRSWALERYIFNLAPDSPETLVAKMRLLLQIEAERQFDLEEGTEVLQQAIAYLEAQMAASPSCVIDEEFDACGLRPLTDLQTSLSIKPKRLDDELEQILTANREALAQMSPAELLAERNRTVDQVVNLSDEEAEIEEDNGQPTHKRIWALERYIFNLAPGEPESLLAKLRLLIEMHDEDPINWKEIPPVLEEAIAHLETQMAAPPSCVIDAEFDALITDFETNWAQLKAADDHVAELYKTLPEQNGLPHDEAWPQAADAIGLRRLRDVQTNLSIEQEHLFDQLLAKKPKDLAQAQRKILALREYVAKLMLEGGEHRAFEIMSALV